MIYVYYILFFSCWLERIIHKNNPRCFFETAGVLFIYPFQNLKCSTPAVCAIIAESNPISGERSDSMKLKKAILLALSLMLLSGCSLHEIIPAPSVPSTASTTAPVSESTVATEPPVTTVPPTEPPTEPPATTIATQPVETAPLPTETVPPQEVSQPEPEDSDFVKVTTYIPDILVDLRYATENNFTGQVIYDFEDVWLRYGTVKKLMAVQEELREKGLGLKIWDGFRPPSAQFKLWEVCPDPTYVSNPNKGFSSHSRGNTVDLTLVRSDGTELTMPTGFDDFSRLADRDYSDCTEEAAANALLLENLMKEHGFKPYSGEWWHFTDTESYDVEQTFQPVLPTLHYADCNEFISLRTAPSTTADVITKIPAGEQFLVAAEHGEFFLAEYLNLFGYVLSSYTQPLT